MTKYLIPISIVITGLVIAGAVIYTNQSAKPLEEAKEEGTPGVKIAVKDNDHIRGDFEAPVTIVEFSDFQCPFCSRFHPTVQQIVEDYPNQVRWVYKHFPLDSTHPQARPAAEASECIWEQKGNEGFWQFSDGLFGSQSKLGASLYAELAANLGLNMAQFESCVSSRKYQDHVEADLQEGIKLGVRGTPGSFVNGVAVSGAVSYTTLKAAVEQALPEL